jgi:valyl-tRNA synthetase
MNQMDTVYKPESIEKKWYKVWEDTKAFKPNLKAKGKTFSIIMPPPNVTGKLHMGHALDNVCQDALIRYKRMKGFKTLWIPGTDHAGIATQSVVEKQLFKEQKKTRHDLGRESFVKEIWKFKEAYGQHIVDQLKTLGVSCDWDYFTFTLDLVPNMAVKKTFCHLFNEGLIYQAEKIINWDPTLQSAISDAEVDYQEVKGKFYHIAYKVVGTNQELIVATTRPETLFGDTAVAVNPKDPRFKNLIGKKALIPICNREIPIIGDEHVDMETGTGCLKVTPGHDFNDFEIGKRHKLPIINLLKTDGTFNSLVPELQGLNITKAREKTLSLLENLSQLKEVKDHIHQVGHGERSGSVIEPMVSKQWFLNVKDMSKVALDAVKNGKMKFFPKGWENTYFSWLENPQDWCLSRQLWWGHQIPVYTCEQCHHQFAAEQDPSTCPKCGSKKLQQDPDVLDTWFSSGLWPLSTLGWPDTETMKKKNFDTFYPTTTLVTGFDIIFFWVARMMMMCTKMSKKVPFSDVYIHAIVRDKQGRKMSKSLGNGIDPIELVEQYGCDAVRFTLAAGSGYNRNLNLDPARIEGYRNFMNKIWNAFRFISPFLNEKEETLNLKSLSVQEKWILSELNVTITQVNASMDEYRFDDSCSVIYSFVYDKLCSWFIELSKNILYGEKSVARTQRINVLRTCFRQILKLLHPISPYLSEELWSQFNRTLLINEEFPAPNKNWKFSFDQSQMNKFIDIVSALRNLKISLQLSPKEKITANFFTDDAKLAKFLFDNKLELKKLVNIYHGTIEKKVATKPNKAIMAATTHCEIYVPAEKLIDIPKEINRLKSQLEKIQDELSKNQAKLNNQQFISRAPQHVVDEVQSKVSDCLVQKNSITESLKRLGSH